MASEFELEEEKLDQFGEGAEAKAKPMPEDLKKIMEKARAVKKAANRRAYLKVVEGRALKRVRVEAERRPAVSSAQEPDPLHSGVVEHRERRYTKEELARAKEHETKIKNTAAYLERGKHVEDRLKNFYQERLMRNGARVRAEFGDPRNMKTFTMELLNLNATAISACNECVTVTTKVLSVLGLLVSLFGVALGGGVVERVKNWKMQADILALSREKLEVTKSGSYPASLAPSGTGKTPDGK